MLSLLTAGGCRSSRQAVTPAAPTEEVTDNELPARAAAMLTAPLPWTSVKMPVKVRLKSPASVSLSGTAVMERGKGVQISLRFMGMVDVGSLTATPDSVTVIDKYHKLYLSVPTAELLKGLPATVDNLIDLLLGQPFILGGTRPSAGDASLTLAATPDGRWIMTPGTVKDVWQYSFIGNEANRLVSTVLTRSGVPVATLDYSDITATFQAGPVAGEATLTVPGKKPVEADITWRIDRATWGAATITAPRIPSGYRRVNPANFANLSTTFQ